MASRPDHSRPHRRQVVGGGIGAGALVLLRVFWADITRYVPAVDLIGHFRLHVLAREGLDIGIGLGLVTIAVWILARAWAMVQAASLMREAGKKLIEDSKDVKDTQKAFDQISAVLESLTRWRQ